MGSMNEYCIPGDAIIDEFGLSKGCALVATPNVTIGGQELFSMATPGSSSRIRESKFCLYSDVLGVILNLRTLV